MAKIEVPDFQQAEIIARNTVDPDEVGVIQADKDHMILLNYRTGDTIRIERGERQWY